MVLSEILLTEAVKTIFGLASNQLKKLNFTLSSSEQEIDKALNSHIREVKNWSSEITFKDLQSSKQTLNVYIELNLYLYPKRIRISEAERVGIISLKDLLRKEPNHIAILGQPGAGKTTSMKFICQSILHDENFFPDGFRYPILIKLREFNKKSSTEKTAGIIIEHIFKTLGLRIDTTNQRLQKGGMSKTKERLVVDILEKLNALVIIEGFDELVYKKHQNIILSEISTLANHLESAKLIVTSRSADYNYSSENIAEYEFCSLTEAQILEFSLRWLGDEQLAKKFVGEVLNSPFADTVIRPLTIAHLCAIYERIGKIPDKPKTVYRKIINLLLEEWDEQRNIKRITQYSSFEVDRKFEFLSALAFELTVSIRRSVFSKDDLLRCYKGIHIDFDLEFSEALGVINELESHTGLFIQAGFEIYEFAHKSLQEYLTAEYMVKLPKFPDAIIISRLPNELAIAIAISSSPSLYFTELVSERFLKANLKLPFIHTFINRLLLEKPDFNNDQRVTVAALQLYNLYLAQFEESSEQLSLFVIDNLVKEFEDFMIKILKRNSMNIISENYSVGDFHVSTNTNKIWDLNLNESTALSNLPKNLKCRESFLTAFDKKGD